MSEVHNKFVFSLLSFVKIEGWAYTNFNSSRVCVPLVD